MVGVGRERDREGGEGGREGKRRSRLTRLLHPSNSRERGTSRAKQQQRAAVGARRERNSDPIESPSPLRSAHKVKPSTFRDFFTEEAGPSMNEGGATPARRYHAGVGPGGHETPTTTPMGAAFQSDLITRSVTVGDETVDFVFETPALQSSTGRKRQRTEFSPLFGQTPRTMVGGHTQGTTGAELSDYPTMCGLTPGGGACETPRLCPTGVRPANDSIVGSLVSVPPRSAAATVAAPRWPPKFSDSETKEEQKRTTATGNGTLHDDEKKIEREAQKREYQNPTVAAAQTATVEERDILFDTEPSRTSDEEGAGGGYLFSDSQRINEDFWAAAEDATMQALESWLHGDTMRKLCDVYRSMKIEKLHKWQAECLSLPGVADGSRNLVYVAPTSGGKTLVSEIIMLRRYFSTGRGSLLVLPFVSLCAEKHEQLAHILKGTNIKIQTYYGGESSGRDIMPDGVGVVICTLEKANQIVDRLMVEERLHDLGCVIVDEAHMVSDGSRGQNLELLLTKLLYVTRRDPAGVRTQIIAMSATLPRPEMMAKWLDAELYETEKRPTELRRLLKVSTAEGNFIKDTEGKTVTVIPARKPEHEKMDRHHVAYLSNEVASIGGAVIIFCPTKQMCATCATKLAELTKEPNPLIDVPTILSADMIRMDFLEEMRGYYEIEGGREEEKEGNMVRVGGTLDTTEMRKELVKRVRELKGHNKDLANAMERGIGFHNSSLRRDEQSIVVTAMKCGAVRILCATTTLAAGVNLPARRVIFREPHVSGGQYKKDIDPVGYRQMAGRAGRSGLDNYGDAILIVTADKKKQEKEEEKLMRLMKAPLPPLKSILLEHEISLEQAMLQVVANGTVSSADDVKRFVDATMMHSFESNSEERAKGENQVVQRTIEALTRLGEKNLIRFHNDKFLPLSLGSAAAAASLNTQECVQMHDILSRARKSLCLETDLHLIWLITPFDSQIRVDYSRLDRILRRLNQIEAKVPELCGIEHAFVGGKNGQGHGQKADEQRLLCGRFYSTLILQQLCQEKDAHDVAHDWEISSADVEALQDKVGPFSTRIIDYCERMGWTEFATLLTSLKSRVALGVRPELAELAEIKGVKAHRARALYKAGLRTPQNIVDAGSAARIHEILVAGGCMKGKNERKEKWEAASILANARVYVKEKLEHIQAEAEKMSNALNVKSTQNIIRGDDALLRDGDGSDIALGSQDAKQCTSFTSLTMTASEEDEAFFEQLRKWKKIVFSIDCQQYAHTVNVIGIAVCGGGAAAGVYIPLTTFQNNEQVFNKLRWNAFKDAISSKDVEAYTWDLRSQLHGVAHSNICNSFDEVVRIFSNCEDMRIAAWMQDSDHMLFFDSEDVRSGALYYCRLAVLETFIGGIPDGTKLKAECRAATQHITATDLGHSAAQHCRRAAYTLVAAHHLRPILDETGMYEAFKQLEMPIIFLLTSMERIGFGFDGDVLTRQFEMVKQKLDNLAKKAFKIAGEEFVLESPQSCSIILYDKLQIPPPPTARRGVRNLSTSKDVLKEILESNSTSLRPEHRELVGSIAEHRKLSSLLEKFTTLCSTQDAHTARTGYHAGKVYTSQNQRRLRGRFLHTCSGTGRIQMDEPNLQCITKPISFNLTQDREDREVHLRGAFVARDGWLLLSADYSQVEFRIMAHFSEDPALVDIFRRDEDPFRGIAASWLQKPVESVVKAERNSAKQLCYAVLYGMGANSLAIQLSCTTNEARERRDSFARRFPRLQEWFQEKVQECEERKYITTISGRRRKILDIQACGNDQRSSAKGKTLNSICQGSAADLIKRAMVDISKAGLIRCPHESTSDGLGHLLLELHDELIFEVPKDKVQEMARHVKRLMENAYTLKVPMVVQLRSGESWGSLAELTLE